MPRMNRAIWLTAAVVSLASFTGACSSEPPPEASTPQPSAMPMPSAEPMLTASAVASVEPAPQLPPVDLVAGNPAAAPDKAPTVAIKSPAKDQLIAVDKVADFDVKLDVKGWDSTGGNHVHLFIDGHAYKRVDDAKAPIKLNNIDPNYTLAEGQHVLAAFPSRHTHESVKPVGKVSPLAVVTFYVGKKKGEATWKPTDPTLVYSRPKGANNGPPPAEGILVDFYLANVELGDGKFSIDATLTGPGLESGKKVSIREWKPWRIQNPRDGAYKLHMTLLDKDGKPVPGALNDVTREFTVDSKAEPDHSHPVPPPTPEPSTPTGKPSPKAPAPVTPKAPAPKTPSMTSTPKK